MKIKVCLHEGKMHLHVRSSKSKSRLKNILNHESPVQNNKLHAQTSVCQNGPLSKNTKLHSVQPSAKSKKSCHHKNKHNFDGNSDYEFHQFGHHPLDQLYKENWKLRNQNKVLNEYCIYFEKKIKKQQTEPSQSTSSRKGEMTSRGRQLFGQLSKQTAATSYRPKSKYQKYVP